ncbi:VOC family protein [uncultured Sphingomonas sp.]|uniref:VOC family protein n=1 Tax=uncultured Sphingomonas sp. TaxID=158754 RepID=UPI0025E57F78|nr:VOC family protein [uncultured Sphingomonas sp.]
MRLNQVTVAAVNFQASVMFYRTLGLRLIVSSRDEYARFELPHGEATFSIHLQDAVPSNGPVIYLEVDDLDATVARLQSEGLVFSSEPRDQPWLWREARLSDPAGNQLCIFHAGSNRRYPPWRLF